MVLRYAEVMAGLIDLPMQHIMDRVCGLRDIGIEECNQLYHIMKTIIDARESVVPAGSSSLSGQPDGGGGAGGGGGGGSARQQQEQEQQDGYILVEAEARAAAGTAASSGDVSATTRSVGVERACHAGCAAAWCTSCHSARVISVLNARRTNAGGRAGCAVCECAQSTNHHNHPTGNRQPLPIGGVPAK